MQTTFTVYNDPGHAWAKVSRDILADVGLTFGHFSSYSYVRGDSIYLEEDCDLTLFARVFERETGTVPQWSDRHCNGRSSVRDYERNIPDSNYSNPFAK